MLSARSKTDDRADDLSSAEPVVGYVAFAPTVTSAEAGWLRQHLGVRTRMTEALVGDDGHRPAFDELVAQVRPLLSLGDVVVEGPRGFLAASVLRSLGFRGCVTVLPYVNPRSWTDVVAVVTFSRFVQHGDRVWVGSTQSARLYGALGVPTMVGEPYGIDDAIFRPRRGSDRVRQRFDIPDGPMLLYTGRAQEDKDLFAFLRVAFRAQLLFPDLAIVVATHVVDDRYLQPLSAIDQDEHRLRLVTDANPDELADLYSEAQVFLTASLSGFETFGRSAAEALCCGCPVVASRYDGFIDVLAQQGGTLVDPVVPADQRRPPSPYEPGLLRAVYDQLSTTMPANRAAIAQTARERFGRSGGIGLLDYLARPSVQPPIETVRPIRLEFPPAWSDSVARMRRDPPAEVLAGNWSNETAQLTAWDSNFEVTVRRVLCGAPGLPEKDAPCQ